METPTVGGYLKDTQQAVWLHKNGCSWRKFGAAIDVPHGILHAIANGRFQHVSWDTVRIVRRHLGLFDPGPIVETFACPDCDEGEPHTTRCHGKPVAAVVCLAPDETVRPGAKPRSPRPPAHRPYITDDRKWRAYQEWSRQYDAQEDTQP